MPDLPLTWTTELLHLGQAASLRNARLGRLTAMSDPRLANAGDKEGHEKDRDCYHTERDHCEEGVEQPAAESSRRHNDRNADGHCHQQEHPSDPEPLLPVHALLIPEPQRAQRPGSPRPRHVAAHAAQRPTRICRPAAHADLPRSGHAGSAAQRPCRICRREVAPFG
jgi:hypothetical protein